MTHVPPCESIDFIIDVSLNLFALIEAGTHLCPEVCESAYELVKITVCTIVGPQSLTVVGIVSTIETLLGAIVDDRNAL